MKFKKIILTIEQDGNYFICKGEGFVDLQESSNYAYGKTILSSIRNFLKIKPKKIKCVFCDNENFELPYKGYIPKIGEMIKCSSCGNLNDFEILNNLALRSTIKNGKIYFPKF